MCMCVYVCVYILDVLMMHHTYVYMCECMYVCIYVCMYIYIYIERERERARTHMRVCVGFWGGYQGCGQIQLKMAECVHVCVCVAG